MSVNISQSISEITLIFYEALCIVTSTDLLEKLVSRYGEEEKEALDRIITKCTMKLPRKLLAEAEDQVNERLKANRPEPAKSVSKSNSKSSKSDFQDMVCGVIPKTINTKKNVNSEPCPHPVTALINDIHPRCNHHKKNQTLTDAEQARVGRSGFGKKDIESHVSKMSNSKTKRSVIEDSDSDLSNEEPAPIQKSSSAAKRVISTKISSAAKNNKTVKSVVAEESGSDGSNSEREKRINSKEATSDLNARRTVVKNGLKKNEVDSEDDEQPENIPVVKANTKTFVANVSSGTRQIFAASKPKPSDKSGNDKLVSKSDQSKIDQARLESDNSDEEVSPVQRPITTRSKSKSVSTHANNENHHAVTHTVITDDVVKSPVSTKSSNKKTTVIPEEATDQKSGSDEENKDDNN